MYDPELLSVCDTYGLYVVAGIENDHALWYENYYSLLQKYSSVIGLYTETIPSLKDSVEKMNRTYNIWRNALCLNKRIFLNHISP
ncbi:MAG TPA: hypothetical protein VF473_02835, partial [Cyclobacteriaceae bacterium]